MLKQDYKIKENVMDAMIFDIKRFAVHDGAGIRTTVFFKGCPLACVWCHNPEGIEFKPEIQYIQNKCLNCGKCEQVCGNDAHYWEEDFHHYKHQACTRCGSCTESCLSGALRYCGKMMSVDEVVEVLLKDKDFYDQSGGGITLSGGECLCQADFCAELLKRLKKYNINCNIDTCGYVDKCAIDKVAPYTDVFLYDIKHIDSELHKKYTGVPNEKIIENLRYINSLDKPIEVRIPLIPGINDDVYTISKIGELLKEIDTLKIVKILPYNNLAGSKYENLGKENTMPNVLPPSKEKIEEIKKILEGYRLTVSI